MTLQRSRYRVELGVLALVLILAGVLVSVAQAAHPDQALHVQHQMESLVQDLKIVVRHRDNAVPPHTYHHFAPTRIWKEGDTLIIEASVTEAPAERIADVTIRLQTTKPVPTPQRGAAGHWWFDDVDRINSAH